MRLTLLFSLLASWLVTIVHVQATAPFIMNWSNKDYGPDGPWQAVEVSVGSPPQTIALYALGPV